MQDGDATITISGIRIAVIVIIRVAACTHLASVPFKGRARYSCAPSSLAMCIDFAVARQSCKEPRIHIMSLKNALLLPNIVSSSSTP